jgi:hypothetical protein
MGAGISRGGNWGIKGNSWATFMKGSNGGGIGCGGKRGRMRERMGNIEPRCGHALFVYFQPSSSTTKSCPLHHQRIQGSSSLYVAIISYSHSLTSNVDIQNDDGPPDVRESPYILGLYRYLTGVLGTSTALISLMHPD